MKELKAIEILKHNKNAMIKFINSFDDDCKEDDEYISGNKYIEELNEAIKELEELNNRSCLSCIFAYRDKNKKIDDVQGQVLGSKPRWSYCKKLMLNVTKDFCCNRFEAKGE